MSIPASQPVGPATPIAKVATGPAPPAESKPVIQAEAIPAPQPANSVESKIAAKGENRQAGKGSKRRPFNAKVFGANYGAIRWGHGQAQRPKH